MIQKIQALKVKVVALLSALVVIIVLVMTFLYIQNLNRLVVSNIELFSSTLLSKEKRELKSKIDLASNIIDMYYQQTKPKYMENVVKKALLTHQQQLFSQLTSFYKLHKDEYPKKKLQDEMKLLVKYARYGKSGYFWINDMDYKMVMHPIKPRYDGNYFIHAPKVPFVALGIDSLKNSDKNDAFIKYKFYNPATKQYEFKVSLVKLFKPFNWIIGTGQYLSNVTPMVKKRALKDIKALRYGNKGFFWINDTDYKMIMYPIKPEYDGMIFKQSKRVPFVRLGIEALKKTKNSTAIIRYIAYNPSTNRYEKKLSIVKIFKPWNWIIGTGVYLNEIDNSIKTIKFIKDREEKRFAYKIIVMAMFIVAFTIVIAYYLVVNFIVKPVRNLNDEKIYFEEISQVDFLTNILNRRAFFDEVDKYFAYAKRNELAVSVIMIDIDHFKIINDTYGHEAGDEVLKKLSLLIKECIREEDIFGRIGGEEFGLCILNASDSIVHKIAEKIRVVIEESSVVYRGNTIKFTVSIGGYTVKSKSERFSIALSKADKALYAAKNGGRNRFEIYDTSLYDEKDN